MPLIEVTSMAKKERKIKVWLGIGSLPTSKLVFGNVFSTKKEAEKVLKKHGWLIVPVEIERPNTKNK